MQLIHWLSPVKSRRRKRLHPLLVLILAAAAGFGAASARADVSVQILATDPAPPATLGRWQPFSLRIGYSSDQPIRIRAQPFFAGKPVPAFDSGAPRHEAGSGEAYFWFAFTDPRQVDSVTVTAEAQDGTILAQASRRLDLTWTGEPGAPRVPAAWVARLKAEQEQLQARDVARMNASISPLADAVGDAMMAAVPIYFVVQLLLPWLLHGGWRKAATAPLWLMVPVLIYTLIAMMEESNLFPLVLIFTAPFALIYLLLVAGLAWLVGPPAADTGSG